MNKSLLILFITISQSSFSQTTDFSWSGNNTTVCLPASIHFTQTSGGSPVGYLWDFGNGTRSNSANPIAVYTTAGNYSVRLITVYANNTAEKIHTITISPAISASFNSNVTNLCQPGPVDFTAVSSGSLAEYIWNFGDSTSLVTGTANNITHNFTRYGEFNVTLTARATSGCSVIYSKIIKIKRLAISGSVTSALTGCVPAQAHFTSTINLPAGNTVTNYTWTFGDGSVVSGTSSQLSHNYTQVGEFFPTLTINTSDGCTGTYSFDSLKYGRPPTNQIAYPFDSVFCGSETPQFVAVANNANRYDWNFGGGNIISVTDTLTEHKYTGLGIKHVSVTPYYNGCAGSTVNFQVRVIGVIARFFYANTCTDKNTFTFDNSSLGYISTINWDLGNQASSTNRDTVSHTYPTSGMFNVKMLITDTSTGCVDSFKTTVYTAKPILKNTDQSICINTQTQFNVLNNYLNPSLSYLWNVVGLEIGPGADSSPVVTASILGHFSSQVILNNGPQYCLDTIHLDHGISVRGPLLDFTLPENTCLNSSLNIVNHSHPFQTADSIKTWHWDFGDSTGTSSIFQPQAYHYAVAGSYNIKLSATDKNGCNDTLVKTANIRPMPFLWIIPKVDTVCQGRQSTLIGYTSDQILWTPASPVSCSTCDTPNITPTTTTKFYATATNSFNCVASDSALVKVFKPFTATGLTPDTAVCAGSKVQLDVAPKDKMVVWAPVSTLSAGSIYNPVAAPVQTTVYHATLTDSAGCFSSEASIKISTKSLPTVNAGPDKIYPYHSSFNFTPVYSSNVASWLWSPSDSLSCNSCPFPVGIAASTKTYTIKVVSDSGCLASDNITVSVECKDANLMMPSAFTPNNDNLNDYYYPIARGIKNITRFVIYNREGQIVYERKDFSPNKDNMGWNGKVRGLDQNPAAYIYFVEAICDLGQTIFAKGSFLLVR